ncbi:MAG: murein tripeptide amidase MpaA [Motiliproteus sp.]|jgi:murein tripeptide amidase MpaA
MTGLHISAAFEGGNIETVALHSAADIQLRIRPDVGGQFYQWFYYRLVGGQGQDCRMRLLNAGGASYPQGWENYRAVASYDRKSWFRVPTRYEGKEISKEIGKGQEQEGEGELIIEHRPEQNSVYYAYFAPYSWERHQDRLAWTQHSSQVAVESLGSTLDGRELDLLQIGTLTANPLRIWVTARQHPGETMAEWLLEGLIDRLVDSADPVAAALLERAVFYLVPNMNPDGSVRGHLRTNALGVNLNREWQAPSMARSPEVYQVLERMQQTGVDLFLDIHGDETLPYNFVAGCGANPGFSDRIKTLETAFSEALVRQSPDFQVQYGYTPDEFGEETLTLASNQVGQRFDCLSLTLELPFKDNALRPDARFGWSPQRSQHLGRALLDAIQPLLDKLR